MRHIRLYVRGLGNSYRRFLIAAALAIAAVPSAQADGNTVTVGEEQIAIPAVPGFDNYTDDPKGQQVASTIIESNAQLLSFQAQPGPLTRYLIVKVPKMVIVHSMSVQEFRGYTAYSRANALKQQQYGDLATQQAAERRTQLNDNFAQGHDIENLKFDAPIMVGIDRDDDVAFTQTKLSPMKFSADGKPVAVMVAMCASSILVKGKYIIAQLFGPAQEVEWT